MSVYLLTWNPTNFSTNSDEVGQLDYTVGEEIRWSCNSKQPKNGDIVYLVRVGVEPRGIIAKGIVTQESYMDSDWKNPENQRSYINFKLKSLRTSCEQGLLPILLLNAALPEQNWSPQSSGIRIKDEVVPQLDAFWLCSQDKHSLIQFLVWDKETNFNVRGWYQNYQQTCELAKQIKLGKEITDDDIKLLWYTKANGIASVGNGFMYKEELNNNLKFLKKLTTDILNNPTDETYQHIINIWKKDGTFKRVLWASIHRLFGAASPQSYTSIAGNNYLNALYRCLQNQFQLDIEHAGSWVLDNQELLTAINPYIPDDWDVYCRNILLWNLSEWAESPVTDKEEDQIQEELKDYNEVQGDAKKDLQNIIFYGAPGTGKTFYTIEAAVKAADLNYYTSLNIDIIKGTTSEQRDALKKQYNILSKSGRIRFVTFHQSYGYEEFVEGLKAETDNSSNVSYFVKNGIFKKICQDAEIKETDSLHHFDKALTALKQETDGQMLSLKTSRGKVFAFTYHGNATFRIYPEATKYDDLGNGYPASIDHLRSLYITGDDSDIYNRSYVRSILSYLKDHYHVADYDENEVTGDNQNFVLVIDEINRGNISKIFGELITLIEPTKRKGAEEALEVTLPYSGDTFSVPDNLHIIGTMNTADRSLALMDTALRRRFDFVEMMPKPELFKNRKIKNIDLTELLTTLNKRIEVLYDREHTLGHAFLFPVYNEQDEVKAFELLKMAFKNKIIPLLEEYFFDDWNRIRLVLGDNQKDKALRFVTKQEDSYESLFGADHGLNTYEDAKVTFQLASFDGDGSVWDQPEAYIAIYASVSSES